MAYNTTGKRKVTGTLLENGQRAPVWHSTGADGDDSQIASIATAQSFTGVVGAAYRVSAADGTNAASIASGTPENVYVRFSGASADGTTRDWLWRASICDLEFRVEQNPATGAAMVVSFVAVNGGAVKLFFRRLW